MVVRVTLSDGRDTGTIDVDLEVLTMGRETGSAGGQGIADVPFIREAVTVSVDVGGPARVLVGSDRVLLFDLL